LKDRPLILKRYPNGIDKPSFHQHDVDAPPDFVRTVSIAARDGHMVDYILTNNVETLVYVANLGSIECHPWHARVRDLDRPDWCVFDLDPAKDVSFAVICDLAMRLRAMLEQLGLESFAKTSGSRGMHVYVPFNPAHSSEVVARFAEQIATALSRENPDIATVERSLKKRPPQSIYVDHQQNARGKSVAAAYSVRPRPGATVSAPLEWAEVKSGKITPEDFTIENMLDRIQTQGDLFSPVLAPTQKLPVKS
jgi:bifunctional non-homologous end joining protein LigD